MKNDENGAAMKKGDGCHKKCKTGQQTKKAKKAKNKVQEGPKNRAKKRQKGAQTRVN